MIDNRLIKEIFSEANQLSGKELSFFAFRDDNSCRSKEEEPDEVRSNFALDRDRILYSGAFRRYQGKTQVVSFSNFCDEEMSNRSIHTIYVAQIARTIGKVLRLNLELIEAVSLGHDLGHPPFGHEGEKVLDRVCREYGLGGFFHNIQSLNVVDNISRKGRGLNLTFQVRDGIISHDGEIHEKKIIPDRTKSEKDLANYISQKMNSATVSWYPATLEACVVRASDTIAYIGQDIEDAIRNNIIDRNDLPVECTEYLGDTNSKIIDSLIKSVILNSYEKDSICFDDTTSRILKKLKKFNYERIYSHHKIKRYNDKIHRTIPLLFEKYTNDIKNEKMKSKIFIHFLNTKEKGYIEKFSIEEKVRDFIATMTDRYFNEEIKDYLLPGKYF